MMPSLPTMKPEPWPRVGVPPWGPGGRKRLKKGAMGSSGARPGTLSSESETGVLLTPVTLMLTTAGPLRAVIWVKSTGAPPEASGALAVGPVLPADGAAAALMLVRVLASALLPSQACPDFSRPEPVAPSRTAALSARTRRVGVIVGGVRSVLMKQH